MQEKFSYLTVVVALVSVNSKSRNLEKTKKTLEINNSSFESGTKM